MCLLLNMQLLTPSQYPPSFGLASLHFLAILVAASAQGGAAEVARVRVWLVGSRGRESRWVGDQLEHNAVYVVGSGSSALFRTFPFYFSFSPHPIGTRSTHRLFAGLFVFSLPPAPGSQWHRHGRASRCCGVAVAGWGQQIGVS